MIVTAALWAGGAVLLSGAILWTGFHLVQSFGDFAGAFRESGQQQAKVVQLLLAVHESQQMIVGDNAKMWAAIQKAKQNGHNTEAA